MIALRRYFRLLPAVLLVGFGLLAIKGIGLARATQASTSNAPDNSGLAPADAGGANGFTFGLLFAREQARAEAAVVAVRKR